MSDNLIGYRDLDVWQKAMKLVEAVDCIGRDMPASERFANVANAARGSFGAEQYR